MIPPILHRFDDKAGYLFSAACARAAGRGHPYVDAHHFLLAWLQHTGYTPAGVSGSRYDTALDYLVQRSASLPTGHHEVGVVPPFVDCFKLAAADSARFAPTHELLDHRWIIPNLLDGRRAAAQVVGLLGVDLLGFITASLSLLGEPFPRLTAYYLDRLHVKFCKTEADIILHRTSTRTECDT